MAAVRRLLSGGAAFGGLGALFLIFVSREQQDDDDAVGVLEDLAGRSSS